MKILQAPESAPNGRSDIFIQGSIIRLGGGQLMILDNVELVKVKDMFCCETAMAIVATYLKHRYEMVFIDAWKFNFRPTDPNFGQASGFAVDIDYIKDWNIENLLEKYHGIRITWHDKTENALHLLRSELEKGYPVYVLAENNHEVPPIVIIGLDENTNEIHYIDTHNLYNYSGVKVMHTGNWLPKRCATYSPVGEDVKEIDWCEIIIDKVKQLYDTDTFKAIRAAAGYMGGSFDLLAEMQGKSNILEVFVVQKFETAARSRFLFSLALNYLNELYNIQGLTAITNKLVELSNQWHLIKYLLTKSLYARRINETFYAGIAAKILEIAAGEEELANMLLDITQNQVNPPALDMPPDRPAATINRDVNKVSFVDLKNYVNNQGFGAMDNTDGADLSGVGQFLLRDEICQMKKWRVGPMEFHLPLVASANDDNIACTGQTINLNEGCYKSIMLLGCSVFGSFSEKAIINYQNGDRQEIQIQFTNVIDKIPLFGETIAWTGNMVENQDNQRVISSCNGYLFAKMYDIKYGAPLKSIKLPDYPSIHIFSISLGK
jgi:hypothetical protein